MTNTGNFFYYTKPIEDTLYLNRDMIEKIMKHYGAEVHWRFKSNVVDMEKAKAKGKVLGYDMYDFQDDLTGFLNQDKLTLYSPRQIALPADSSYLFRCIPFLSIDFQGVNTSRVNNMKAMFAGGVIPLTDPWPAGIDKLGDLLFYRDKKIGEIKLADCDVSHVSDTSFMFYHCLAEKINISSFDLYKVANQESMFEYCKAEFVVK